MLTILWPRYTGDGYCIQISLAAVHIIKPCFSTTVSINQLARVIVDIKCEIVQFVSVEMFAFRHNSRPMCTKANCLQLDFPENHSATL